MKPDPNELLNSLLDESHRDVRDRRSFAVNIAPAWSPHIAEAARRRGLSIAGYTRRALMAIVAHDLGLDFDELMEDEIKPAAYGMTKHGSADLEKAGRWKVSSLLP